MTDKKLTDNEIIKALECCSCETIIYCEDQCPFYKKCMKDEQLSKYALDLITRLQAQNKDLAETVHNLTIEKDALFDKAEELKAEIEKLKTNLNVELENFATEYDNEIKAEAYKEFAKEIFELFPADKCNTVISRVTVKHILKKLVGENGYRTFNENSCS